MPITRLAKIVMCAALAGFCLLVAYDNLVAPRLNYEFVQHVLSMDTTFPDNEARFRSITSPVLWQLTFGFIVAAEIVTGLLFLVGAVRMWQARAASAEIFNRSKTFVIAGSLAAFLLWFFAFMVIAGEWFSMWQSKTWNAQDDAFQFYVTVLAILIFINQPDRDLPNETKRS